MIWGTVKVNVLVLTGPYPLGLCGDFDFVYCVVIYKHVFQVSLHAPELSQDAKAQDSAHVFLYQCTVAVYESSSELP